MSSSPMLKNEKKDRTQISADVEISSVSVRVNVVQKFRGDLILCGTYIFEKNFNRL